MDKADKNDDENNNNLGKKISASETPSVHRNEEDDALSKALLDVLRGKGTFGEVACAQIDKKWNSGEEVSFGEMAMSVMHSDPQGREVMENFFLYSLLEDKYGEVFAKDLFESLEKESDCLEKALADFAKRSQKGVEDSLVLPLFAVQYIGKAIKEENYKKLEMLLTLFQVKKLDFSVDTETVSPELKLLRGDFKSHSLFKPMISLLSEAILKHISGSYSLTQLESLLAFAYKIDDVFQYPFLLAEIMKRGDYLQAIFYFNRIKEDRVEKNMPRLGPLKEIVSLARSNSDSPYKDQKLIEIFPSLIQKAIEADDLDALKCFMEMSQAVEFCISDQKKTWTAILRGLAGNWNSENRKDYTTVLKLLMKFDLSSIWSADLQQYYDVKRIWLPRAVIFAVLEVDSTVLAGLNTGFDILNEKIEKHVNKDIISFFSSMIWFYEHHPSTFFNPEVLLTMSPLNTSPKKG